MMQLAPAQKRSIREATSRINLWEGAVRSAKTWASIIRFAQFIGREAHKSADLLMIGRTERTVYRNIIKPMETIFGSSVKYKHGLGELNFMDKTIFVVGASDERAEGKIRGLTAGGVYGDEPTLWPESVWKMMLSRMSVDNAKFFGATNPDSPYHPLKIDYIDRKDQLDMSVFHFELDDNIFLSEKFKNSLRAEYRGLWFKRFIQGLWVMAEGAVYDFFEDDLHTLTGTPPAITYGVSIDYGTSNPTAIGLFGMNPASRPHVWMEREYYYDYGKTGRQKSDIEICEDLRKFLGGIRPQFIIVDPSAASLKVQLMKSGFMFVRDADNSVVDGIRTQSRMLSSGEYAVSERCPQTIRDYSAYMWDAKAQKVGKDAPLKQHDHTKDMERYFLQTMFGTLGLDLYKLVTK